LFRQQNQKVILTTPKTYLSHKDIMDSLLLQLIQEQEFLNFLAIISYSLVRFRQDAL